MEWSAGVGGQADVTLPVEQIIPTAPILGGGGGGETANITEIVL
jgi:hypothetical protein